MNNFTHVCLTRTCSTGLTEEKCKSGFCHFGSRLCVCVFPLQLSVTLVAGQHREGLKCTTEVFIFLFFLI